jgi:transposase-like protein
LLSFPSLPLPSRAIPCRQSSLHSGVHSYSLFCSSSYLRSLNTGTFVWYNDYRNACSEVCGTVSDNIAADRLDLNFSEADCVEFFYQIKWPEGFRCPQCDHSRAYTIRTRRLPLYECQSCGRQTTITAGTILENTHIPLRKWRTAMLLVAEKSGVNAVQLAERICVAYRTAWGMLKKIRQSISKMDGARLLTGKVSAKLHIYRRGTLKQTLLLPGELAVVSWQSLRGNLEYDYFKLKLVPSEYMEGKRLTHRGAQQLALKHVQPGTSGVHVHRRTSMFESNPTSLYNKVRAWVSSTFHGVSIRYVESYWDEYCFRINQSFLDEPATVALCRICLRPEETMGETANSYAAAA